jgi:hypothetical protein
MGIKYDDKLPQMLDEVRALHHAIVSRDPAEAERLWRDKFERWVRDFIDQMAEGFDRELWRSLTNGVAAVPAASEPARAGPSGAARKP